MTRSTLSEIAFAGTREQKLNFAWKYCQEQGVQYDPINSFSKHPAFAADLIWAHGRYGKRSEALKKIDAMHIVCAFLSVNGEKAA